MSRETGAAQQAGASPVGAQLQLLHGVFQGNQVPDVKGHGVAEVLRCWVCTRRCRSGGALLALLMGGRWRLCTEIGDVHCPSNGLAVLPHIIAVGGLRAKKPLSLERHEQHARC